MDQEINASLFCCFILYLCSGRMCFGLPELLRMCVIGIMLCASVYIVACSRRCLVMVVQCYNKATPKLITCFSDSLATDIDPGGGNKKNNNK